MATTTNVPWHTLIDSKVVYFPLPVVKDNGEDSTRFLRLGVRINLQRGWWFHHFKKGTWSYHHPRVQKTTRWGAPAVELGTNEPILLPEKVDRYANLGAVLKEYGKRAPALITSLLEGRDKALEDEAEKRAAK